MAKISVIVAVYKMKQFLPRCIEGILGQTHEDLELILVDDGCPEGCGAVCDDYAARDRRVHVIHKENAGVCAARNTGLDWVYANSDSRWIFFHDNDDWIHPETLQRLLAAAEESGSRLSICGYQETTGADPVVAPEALVPARWAPEEFYLQHFVNATVCWGKLYHRSCFEALRYPPGKYIEDEFVTYRILFDQEFLTVVAAPLYAYFINPAGISKKAWVPKRLDCWEAYDQQLVYFAERSLTRVLEQRYRNYLESALKNLEDAKASPNAAELAEPIGRIEKKIRTLLRQMWRRGFLEFWPDHEVLQRYYPLLTRLYRFWYERKN